MDSKAIDKFLIQIIEKKAELNALTYDDKGYDKIEDELHEMEDEFMDIYGDDFSDILEEIHDELEAENDVLLPIAYLATQYVLKGQSADGTNIYDVRPTEGIPMDTDKYVGKIKRLVLIPNPLRFLLQIDTNKREIVWQVK
ncbi:MAG TPA: hypothetical protein VK766_09490 [Cytophagaceae bacterium]|jgi:hypothetical protein|nr:hypothetical protein [Cytophagaceae bacterium]